MIGKERWVMLRSFWKQGMNKSQIARALGIDRKTVANNLKKSSIPKYVKRVKRESKLEPYKDYIKSRLDKHNLTASRLYEEILTQGYTGKYGILASFVRSIKNLEKQQAVLRFETLPGLQSQVDWGYFGRLYDEDKKKYIKVYCFFMILGYSRALYIEFFDGMHITNFLRGHNNAFKYFGGYTKEYLYDNLKSVVIKRALRGKDSEFNKKFMDFAGYYGFEPILCRIFKPNTKGKVENSVGLVKRNFYVGQEYRSLRELNEKRWEWLEAINSRQHTSTREKPFERLKREGLMSYTRLYDTSEISYRRVMRDCHFSFGGNKYSVPYKYATKEVAIKKKDEENIVIIYRGKEIAKHELNTREKGVYITKEEHLTGLKEVRRTHKITKAWKRAKNKAKELEIRPIWGKQLEEVEIRNLKKYEVML